MSIGSKIKSLRKKRGMTQKTLAEGIVTRGMLSRIESGSALPSMQSLQSLAVKLEVSPAFLLEEGNDILPAELARIAKIIEEEYRAKNFQSCLELFSIWQLENDSKFSTFFVLCAFEVALKAFYDGNFRRCKELLDKIESLLPTLIIKSTVTHNRISFLKSVIDNIDNIDNAIDLANSIPDFEFSPSLFFSLLKLLKSGNHETCQTLLYYCSIETNYRDFLSAQMAIKDYRFIDAILSMKSLYTKNDCPIFLKLLCLVSIENCCKLCDDYKGAYENHLAYEALLATIEK